MADLFEPLSQIPNLTVRTNQPLAPLTTMGVGGVPFAITCAHTIQAATQVLDLLDDLGVPALVLGGGSNLIIDDGPLPVVVVQLPGAGIGIGDPRFDDYVSINTQTGIVEAQAGITWDDLVQRCIATGLGGLECLSGIPGSVGATPVQNVGAYGVEIAQVLEAVLLYDRDRRETTWVEPDALGLGYRTSTLKFQDRRIVMAVRYRTTTNGQSAPLIYGNLAQACGGEHGHRRPSAKVRTVVLAQRRAKGMVYDRQDPDTHGAGSFFTNPIVTDLAPIQARIAAHCGQDVAQRCPTYPAANGVKLSAAWLIEHAGFAKGWPGDGPARLSEKHTLAITNRGGARTHDIWALAARIQAGVYDAFAVSLSPEPVAYPPRTHNQ